MTIPLPIITNTYRVAMLWREGVTSMSAVNVIHIRAAVSGGNASDVADALNANVTQAMWGPVESAASITTLSITPLDGVTATYTTSVSGLKWTGQASSGQFEPAVAAVVKLSTNARGRQNRGRVFLPFLATSGLGDGSISGSTPTTTSAAWNTFAAALVAATPSFELVVASYDRKNSGASAHATNVLNVTCESLVGTQRKRQGRLRGA